MGILVLVAALAVGGKFDPKMIARAEGGNANAQFKLGLAYASGPKTNKRLAAEWFQKAAVQGDERAMVNLSTMYEAGKGVEMDDAEAVRWAFLAAKGGHPRAQFLIGERFAEGKGVEKNVILAYMWFVLAESAGSVTAQFRVQSLGSRMTPEQRMEAQKLARSWAEVRGEVAGP